MAVSAGTTYPITLAVARQGVSAEFKDKSALISFIQNEHAFWISKINSMASTTIRDVVVSMINQSLVAALSQYAGKLNESASPENDAAIVDEMASHLIFSQGFPGRLFAETIEDMPVGGSGAFIAALSLSGQPSQLIGQLHSVPRLSGMDVAGIAYFAAKYSEISAGPASQRSELKSLLSAARSGAKKIQDSHRDWVAWFDAESAILIEKGDLATKSFQEKIDAVDVQIEEYRQETSNRIEEEIKAVTTRMKNIEDIYVSKKVLEGPSELWRGVEKRAKWSIGISLFFFVVLIFVPIVLILVYWPNLHDFLIEIIKSSQSGISLTAIVAVTAPALLYGWALRHVSRIFIHNMNLQSDAQYRAVLATTFLGLAKQQSAGITDAERALVLNALFRPAPPNSGSDDGPPVGLLEIIKGKP